MRLPVAVRRATPGRLRDSPRLRSVAIGTGLIPPRTLHHRDEAALLAGLARGARRVVEIGVYEGASASVLAHAMPPDAELHLIDPFGFQPGALRAGHRGVEWATRRVVTRAARETAVRCTWHVAYSHDVGTAWTLPVDLVFIDGDHSAEAVRDDWDLFSPHVRPGGHVAIHDARAGVGKGWPGPTAVVDELFRSRHRLAGWTVVAEVERTVAVRREPSADAQM